MKINDSITGLIFVVAGSGIALKAQSFPAIAGQPYGSTFFPTLIGIAMVIGGGMLSAIAIIKRKAHPFFVVPPWLKSTRGLGSFLLVFFALISYMLFADRLGFCLSAFLLILLLQKWMGAKWIPACIIAIAATSMFYIVFSILLRVPLPHGIVEQFL